MEDCPKYLYKIWLNKPEPPEGWRNTRGGALAWANSPEELEAGVPVWYPGCTLKRYEFVRERAGVAAMREP